LLAEHEFALGHPHRPGVHDLEGGPLLEVAVRVNARLVGEGVFADDRLVPGHRKARHAAHEAAGRVQMLRSDLRPAILKIVGPRPERHDDLFHGGVSGPFADAVDRTLGLPGARLDGRKRVGHGQAQVVVTVDRNDGLRDVRDVLEEVPDHAAELVGDGPADRIGDVDGRGARVDDGFDDLDQEVGLGARGVHRRELDVAGGGLGPLDALDGHPHDLGLGLAQLVLAVNGARAQEDVDARLSGVAQGFGGAVDVLGHTAGESRDDGPADLA